MVKVLKTRLKESRERIDLTQKEIASIFKVHVSTVSGWETGKDPIPLRKLIHYCDLFHYSLDYILYLNNKNEQYKAMELIDSKYIGENLKKNRILNNHTQEDVAKFIQISQSCYSNYEKGRKLINTFALYTIAKTYHISADKLIGRKKKIEVPV